jgi:TatD DNase family protein
MVHCLKAWGWLLEILRDVGPLPGGLLIHAYGGSGEVVQTLAQMGAYFSFGGAVLDPSRQRAREALRQVPLDRLLLETDAPALLPPAGFRPYVLRTAEGEQYNEPANLPAICEGIAALLGLPTDQLIDLTTENAFRLYPQRRGPGPMAPAGS